MESFNDFEAFGKFFIERRRGSRFHFFMTLIPQGFDVDFSEQLANGFGPNSDSESIFKSSAIL